MALIDADALQDYLMNYCGSAAFSGFPAAIIDVAEIESMSGEELCEKAEELGVDLRQFIVEKRRDDLPFA